MGCRRNIGSIIDYGLDFDPPESCENPCSYISHTNFLLYFSWTVQLCFPPSYVNLTVSSELLGKVAGKIRRYLFYPIYYLDRYLNKKVRGCTMSGAKKEWNMKIDKEKIMNCRDSGAGNWCHSQVFTFQWNHKGLIRGTLKDWLVTRGTSKESQYKVKYGNQRHLGIPEWCWVFYSFLFFRTSIVCASGESCT